MSYRCDIPEKQKEIVDEIEKEVVKLQVAVLQLSLVASSSLPLLLMYKMRLKTLVKDLERICPKEVK